MTPKETIFATLRHEETDQVPWVPFAGVHAGKLTGYNATEILSDGEKLLSPCGRYTSCISPLAFR